MHRIILVLFLAGCLGSPDPDTSWAERATPFGGDHDHADPAHHVNLSTPNFEVLAFTPLTSDHYGGQVGGGYLCGDAQPVDDGRRLAAIESRSEVAFALADVTDPARPRVLGEFVMEHTYIYDLTVVLDGQHVVMVSAGTDNLPPSAAKTVWNGPCGRVELDPGPYPMNMVLVDISDPTQPVIVDNQPIVGYGHSVFPYRIDGRDILLVTTATGVVGEASGYFLYEVIDTPLGSKLRMLSAHKPPGEGPAASVNGPRGHDGWIEERGGRHIAYLAGASLLTIMDVTTPETPTVLGTWEEPIEGSFLHGAYPVGTHGGRHYLVVGPEYCGHPENTPTGVAWLLDVTDPSAAFAVAAWTLPHEVEWDGCYMFSNHYFTVVDRTLFMSLYHGGIWAVDLAPALADPVRVHDLLSVGVFVPADPSLPAPAEWTRWAPTIEEVIAMPDGTLVTFDGNYGLYTLRYTGKPMASPEPWSIAASST